MSEHRVWKMVSSDDSISMMAYFVSAAHRFHELDMFTESHIVRQVLSCILARLDSSTSRMIWGATTPIMSVVHTGEKQSIARMILRQGFNVSRHIGKLRSRIYYTMLHISAEYVVVI